MTRPRTPYRPLDITVPFPELSAYARTATRLHPCPGTPTAADSSVGGPLLWPAAEAWPVCGEHGGAPLLPLAQFHVGDVPDLPPSRRRARTCSRSCGAPGTRTRTAPSATSARTPAWCGAGRPT
ncbi:hypothetical protein AB6O49_08145 [Streptomyces sp. SBR177]